MAKISVKNTILYIIGEILLSFAVMMTFKSGFGASPVDNLTYIVSVTTGLTLGTAVFVINALLIIFLTIYFKKPQFLFLFAMIIMFSVLLDVWDLWILAQYNPIGAAQWIPFVLAILILPMGCAFLIRSTYPSSVIDELMFFTAHLTHFRLSIARTFNELLLVGIALIVSSATGYGIGSVGLGTFVYALSVGALIKVYLTWFDNRSTRRKSHGTTQQTD